MIRVALTEAAGATNGWGYTSEQWTVVRVTKTQIVEKGIGSGELYFGLPIKAVIHGSFVPSLNKGSISWVEFFVRGERTQTVHFDKPINLQTYDSDFDANLYAGTLLMGNSYANAFRGWLGPDHLFGFGGNDLFDGDKGNDVLDGGRGNDSLFGGDGSDQLIGGNGNDYLDGAAGSDILEGGRGNDTYAIWNRNDAISELADQGIDLVKSRSSYTLGKNLENLTIFGQINGNGTGNAVNNVITGDESANILRGLGGNDTLNGGGGTNDRLEGGRGNDTYYNTGDWLPTIIELEDQGIDTVISKKGITLPENCENVIFVDDGENGGVYASGNGLNNQIVGYLGNDSLWGRGGNDVLLGGSGGDNLSGETGADTFIYRSVEESTAEEGYLSDRIMDFAPGEDKIDLSQIDANTEFEGDQAFTFVGAAAFSGSAGELRYESRISNGIVSADVDGDGNADLQIIIENNALLMSDDFIL